MANDQAAAPWLPGGCHCGRVRFLVRVERFTALACNCSICEMLGFLHVIVPPSDFRLEAGEAELVTYRFNTRTAEHYFCRHCGMHPFYRPRSHPGHIDVNARCLDGGAAARFFVEAFDGRNWEANIDELRARDAP
jgi:hypothetical protein